ncbi:hypothetical protein [Halostella litorea]|uniref:hypothetical protein n=1 Tax=Halostella litorea TaxID=2528831 RepID=UPI001092F2E2|nr:hypothetical protein [Halostella litorea]
MAVDGRGGADEGGSIPVVSGVVAGVGALVAGLAATYLAKSGAIADARARTWDEGGMFEAVLQTPGTDGWVEQFNVTTPDAPTEGVESTFAFYGVNAPGDETVVSWLYQRMHGLDPGGTIEITLPDGSATYALSLNVGVETWLLAVPPLVLTAAGYLVVARMDPADRSAKAGGAVAVGYAVGTAALLVAFAWNESGTYGDASESAVAVSYGADLLPAVLQMGVAYPLVFGLLGGYLACRRTASAAPSAGRRAPGGDQRTPRGGQQGRSQQRRGQQARGRNERAGGQPRNERRDTGGQQRQGRGRSERPPAERRDGRDRGRRDDGSRRP